MFIDKERRVQVHVHERVNQRHSDIADEDAARAWMNCVKCRPASDGDPDRYIAIGYDSKGRALELVAIRIGGTDSWLIIHAQTPPRQDIKRKLGARR